MLSNIDEESAEEARRILMLLCFSERPLSVPEVIDAIAVHYNDAEGLDFDRRLEDPGNLLEICPGLIKIVRDPSFYDEDEFFVQISHFSVQEYLESDRLSAKVARYRLSKPSAHAEIMQICYKYLLEPELQESIQTKGRERALNKFKFSEYAAESWTYHHNHSFDAHEKVDDLVLKLFTQRNNLITWVILKRWEFKIANVAPALHYAVWAGLLQVSQALIDMAKAQNRDIPGFVNAEGGYYGTALQAASYCGSEAIVQRLLEAGADANAQGGKFDTALQVASYYGYEAIVQQLLEAGAVVNDQGGLYGNALQIASYYGHKTIVQQLLDAGADVNIQGGHYGTALQATTYYGHEAIVQQLIEAGADVNAQGGLYGTALQAASYYGSEAIVQRLIDIGADVNAQGGHYGTALQAASSEGHKAIVQQLIDIGADVNAQGGEYGTALRAALSAGRTDTVQILIDAGADVGEQDEPLL